MDEQLRHLDVVDHGMAAVLRAMTPGQRLAIAHGMWRSAVRMIEGVLRFDHPDWTEQQIQQEAARRLSHGTV